MNFVQRWPECLTANSFHWVEKDRPLTDSKQSLQVSNFLDRTISICIKNEKLSFLLEMMGIILWGCICWRYDGFLRAGPLCFKNHVGFLKLKALSWKLWLITKIWLLLISNIASFYKYPKWRNALKCSAKSIVNHQTVMWISGWYPGNATRPPRENKALLSDYYRIIVVQNSWIRSYFSGGGGIWGKVPPSKFSWKLELCCAQE